MKDDGGGGACSMLVAMCTNEWVMAQVLYVQNLSLFVCRWVCAHAVSQSGTLGATTTQRTKPRTYAEMYNLRK